jgi:DNA polymerase
VKPRIIVNEKGNEEIEYQGVNMAKKWSRVKIYPGKITENVVQSFARHVLAHAIKNFKGKYDIVAHVHDEVIIEVPMDTEVSNVVARMTRNPDWATGLILNADGYECEFYQKD